MPSNPETKEIHEELLILLKKFHEICIEHDIKYSLHGGTLLGAIREGGFIPWDDDADITFVRAEYEKFKEVVNTHLESEAEISFSDEDSIPRLWMKRNGKPVVWVDLFIYDYISEHVFFQKLRLFCLNFLVVVTKSEMDLQGTKVGRFRGLVYGCVYLVYSIGKIIPLSKKLQAREWFIKNAYQGKRLFIHRASDQYIGRIIIIPVSWMKEYTTTTFEDAQFLVSVNYHEILVSTYGEDYMTPIKFASFQDEIHEVIRATGNKITH